MLVSKFTSQEAVFVFRLFAK